MKNKKEREKEEKEMLKKLKSSVGDYAGPSSKKDSRRKIIRGAK